MNQKNQNICFEILFKSLYRDKLIQIACHAMLRKTRSLKFLVDD